MANDIQTPIKSNHIKEMPALRMHPSTAEGVDHFLVDFKCQVRNKLLIIIDFNSKETCEANIEILRSIQSLVTEQIGLQELIIMSNAYDK